MKHYIKAAAVGLLIFSVNNGSAMVPQTTGERVSIQIKNNSDKNLNIISGNYNGYKRTASVGAHGGTALISNIELTPDPYMPRELRNYFEVIDPLSNTEELIFQVLKTGSRKRTVVSVMFLPTPTMGYLGRPEQQFFEYDATRGPITVLISITIGKRMADTSVDITGLQGPK